MAGIPPFLPLRDVLGICCSPLRYVGQSLPQYHLVLLSFRSLRFCQIVFQHAVRKGGVMARCEAKTQAVGSRLLVEVFVFSW